MSLEIPESASELAARAKTDVQRELPNSKPFTRNNWLYALIIAFSNRVFDFYLQLLEALAQAFPNTATGEYLADWLSVYKIKVLEATTATGVVIGTGVLGDDILQGTEFISNESFLYTSDETATVLQITQQVDSIVRSGNLVTVVCPVPHGLASGLTITISGSNAFFDGAKLITVITPFIFTFEEANGADDNPSSATFTGEYITVPVTSIDAGANTNLDAGTEIKIVSPLEGFDNTFVVDATAVGGGTDTESESDTQLRLQERIQEPVGNFNTGAITALARTVNGTTRVFVQTPSTATTTSPVTITRLDDGTDNNVLGLATIDTGTFKFISGQEVAVTDSSQSDFNKANVTSVALSSTQLVYPIGASSQDPNGSSATVTGSDVPLGVTKVYFMRDNDIDANGDIDPFPSLSEVDTMKEVLETILPANTSSSDLIVLSPVPIEVDFNFSSITPNTQTMENAIKEALVDMMRLRTSVGINLTSNVINATLLNTFDSVAGVYLEQYNLTTPSGAVIIQPGELPALGDVTFV